MDVKIDMLQRTDERKLTPEEKKKLEAAKAKASECVAVQFILILYFRQTDCS